jgi:hypothetical protein
MRPTDVTIECDSLSITLNAATPEASRLMLLATGVVGLGSVLRRKVRGDGLCPHGAASTSDVHG